ncbi:MAG: 2'-5' RNA ligase family protein [Sphingobacteriales bacterium]|nr:MAG: 2'-5' RNA ligase family protein [Sphingobacteriales bacterium]
MTSKIRRQLTLFLGKEDAIQIEEIRLKYNPQQRELIDSHVTLCREDEIVNIDKVENNLKKLRHKPIAVDFGQAIRFENGKGVLIPSRDNNEPFQKLRQEILKGLDNNPRKHEPHITLLHPRNATCTDIIFESIARINLPVSFSFKAISLIEQTDGGKWETLKTFDLVE